MKFTELNEGDVTSLAGYKQKKEDDTTGKTEYNSFLSKLHMEYPVVLNFSSVLPTSIIQPGKDNSDVGITPRKLRASFWGLDSKDSREVWQDGEPISIATVNFSTVVEGAARIVIETFKGPNRGYKQYLVCKDDSVLRRIKQILSNNKQVTEDITADTNEALAKSLFSLAKNNNGRFRSDNQREYVMKNLSNGKLRYSQTLVFGANKVYYVNWLITCDSSGISKIEKSTNGANPTLYWERQKASAPLDSDSSSAVSSDPKKEREKLYQFNIAQVNKEIEKLQDKIKELSHINGTESEIAKLEKDIDLKAIKVDQYKDKIKKLYEGILLEYSEKDSVFQDGKDRYDLNKIFKSTAYTRVDSVKLSDITWCLSGQNLSQVRVKRADTSVPILVTRKNGKILIVDGAHRTKKAQQNKNVCINAKFVTSDQMKKALITDDDDKSCNKKGSC